MTSHVGPEPHPGASRSPHPKGRTDDAVARDLGVSPEPPVGGRGVGIIAPYDFALDRELWRWVPDDATLHLTRTPFSPLPVTLEQAHVISRPDDVARSTLDLLTVQPDVVAFACTSASFVGGVAGERALVAAMVESGAPSAVTTSGALLEALAQLGSRRVAVATPYDATITDRLRIFLDEAGVAVVGAAHLGLSGRIWTVPYAVTIALVREAFTDDCQAIFVSCTNLPTYDVIAPLEKELGVPLLTANQVTMWAALRRAGAVANGPGQRLVDAPTVSAGATAGTGS